mgnify:CR=1 FL=1
MLLAIVLLWVPWMLHVSLEWRFNPQYGYGWAVPLLAGYAAAQRWGCRPACGGAVLSQRTALAVCLVAVVVLLVTRILSIANPDWRLLGWVLGLVAALCSWVLVAHAVGLRAARWLLFPLLFPLLATPWPDALESQLVLALRQAITAGSVELAGWFGVPARAVGNLIVTANGVLGVDDACSGIRSLQSSLMAALFLGEFHLLRWRWRLGLVALAALLAFVLNLARSLALVLLADSRGGDALGGGHDTAGWVVFLILFGVLLVVAQWGKAQAAGEPPPSAADPRADPPRWRSGRLAAMATAAALVLALAGAQLWFGLRARPAAPVEYWQVEFPAQRPGFRVAEPSPEVRRQLRYDWGRVAEWRGRGGAHWLAYELRWQGGKASAFLALAHGPEVCMPAAGMRQSGPARELEVGLGGSAAPLVFRQYRFLRDGRALDVFHALNGGGAHAEAGRDPWNRRHRLALAWRGIRQQPTQALIVGIGGLPSADTAARRFRAAIPGLLKAGGQASAGHGGHSD